MESELEARIYFIGLAGEVLAECFKEVDSFLELHAFRNNVPLWVTFFDQVLNMLDFGFYVGHF